MIDPAILSPEKRIQILKGAAVVFAQDGYEGASMSRIALEAGVSKGTLYNYFDGKAALFTEHLHAACTLQMSRIFEHLSHDAALEPALREIGARMIGMIVSPERRSLYRMVIAEAESFPELARAFYDAGPAQAVDTLSAWIKVQVEHGALAADDAEFAAEQFFALCQTRLWLRYRLHLQPDPSAAEIARVVDGAVQMFLTFYRPAS